MDHSDEQGHCMAYLFIPSFIKLRLGLKSIHPGFNWLVELVWVQWWWTGSWENKWINGVNWWLISFWQDWALGCEPSDLMLSKLCCNTFISTCWSSVSFPSLWNWMLAFVTLVAALSAQLSSLSLQSLLPFWVWQLLMPSLILGKGCHVAPFWLNV